MKKNLAETRGKLGADDGLKDRDRLRLSRHYRAHGIRERYFSKREITDLRAHILRLISLHGKEELDELLLKKMHLNEDEIEALLSLDVKISRMKVNRFLGVFEGIIKMFLIGVAEDTFRERRRIKRQKKSKKP